MLGLQNTLSHRVCQLQNSFQLIVSQRSHTTLREGTSNTCTKRLNRRCVHGTELILARDLSGSQIGMCLRVIPNVLSIIKHLLGRTLCPGLDTCLLNGFHVLFDRAKGQYSFTVLMAQCIVIHPRYISTHLTAQFQEILACCLSLNKVVVDVICHLMNSSHCLAVTEVVVLRHFDV